MNVVENTKYGFRIRGNDGHDVFVTSRIKGVIEVTTNGEEIPWDKSEAYFETIPDALDYIVALLDSQ